ncbi:MAG TPA: aminoacyl-tRNA hydrolase [Terriglobia bacterium]|nr:aminoacyl-tRNA hydrolase [Terriglobia bacterium]
MGLKLIVGLGNPGFEYVLTPHNLGFMAVDRVAEIWGAEISRPEASALTARTRIENVEVVLAKPLTFMNLSGVSVRRLVERYEIAAGDLTVLLDEAALPLGALRIRARGSAGGHNGLKSILEALGTDDFIRVRMGVEPDHPVPDRAAHVLGRFRRSQLKTVAEMVDRAADAVEVIVREGVESAMNRFNRRPEPN